MQCSRAFPSKNSIMKRCQKSLVDVLRKSWFQEKREMRTVVSTTRVAYDLLCSVCMSRARIGYIVDFGFKSLSPSRRQPFNPEFRCSFSLTCVAYKPRAFVTSFAIGCYQFVTGFAISRYWFTIGCYWFCYWSVMSCQ